MTTTDAEDLAELDELIETLSRAAGAAMQSPSYAATLTLTTDQLFVALAWLALARSSDDDGEAIEIEILFPMNDDDESN